MKIFISTDMEGIAGVVDEKDTIQSGIEYENARRFMTQEVNAAIEGVLEFGINEIFVADSHNTTRNIIAEELNPQAQLISGLPRPLGMMEGIDRTFSGVFFIGYHCKMGTFNGVLDHSFSSNTIQSIKINQKEIGEIGLNSMIAHYFGVPVLLVTGCNKTIEEAQFYLQTAEYVTVKKAIGRTSASSLHPQKARELIKKYAKKSLNKIGNIKIVKPEGPFKLEVTFSKTNMAEMALLMPETERVSALTIKYQSDDFLQTYKAFRALLFLSKCIK